jgi:3-hydroxyisobutyrate dehydrogenase-like beta-hydroxyacid dehydrogenase
MDVGFIGLGRMGRAMARNLAKAGHQVHAWNRSAGHEVEGVTMVSSPSDAFQADVVFTMLSDDPAIREVLIVPNVLRSARKGVVHVVTSTISVAFAEELTALHAKAGVAYLSAPVFGRPDVAEAAQLNIVAAGDPAAIDKVRPLFDVIGRKTFVMGHEPKQANATKVAGNMMIAMAMEAMAEGIAITRSNGVEPGAFIDLMLQTLFGGRVYEGYGPRIVKGDFEAGFIMRLGLKDLRLATEAVEKTGKPLPMLEAVRTQMTAAVEAGMGEKDWLAIADYTLRGRG